MGFYEDLGSVKSNWKQFSAVSKLIATLLLFMQLLAIASIGDNIYHFKGFILQGVELYRTLRAPLINIIHQLNLRIPKEFIDLMVFVGINFWAYKKALSIYRSPRKFRNRTAQRTLVLRKENKNFDQHKYPKSLAIWKIKLFLLMNKGAVTILFPLLLGITALSALVFFRSVLDLASKFWIVFWILSTMVMLWSICLRSWQPIIIALTPIFAVSLIATISEGLFRI